MSELMQLGLIDPSTFELVWTMGITMFLLLAGTLTVWMLPWSDSEIDAVYNSITQNCLATRQRLRPDHEADGSRRLLHPSHVRNLLSCRTCLLVATPGFHDSRAHGARFLAMLAFLRRTTDVP